MFGDDDTSQGYTGGEVGQQGTDAGNPAWAEVLAEIPQEYHEKLTPHLEKWDKGVNDRFEKVHSDYQPWKQFRDAGVDPTQVQFALNVLNSLEENPKAVYDSIGNYYKDDPRFAGTGQGLEEPKIDQDEEPWRKELEQLKRHNEILAQHALNQQQERQKQEADRWLDTTLEGLRKKHGDFDEQYVMAMMLQLKVDPEQAVKIWQQKRDEMVKQYRPRPLLMGANGGMPGQTTDVRKLDDAGTKNLIVQMLEASRQQNQ
jgi:hypothetical protein